MSTANETQVGGSHYMASTEQHWDKMWRLYGEAWFVGNITKYVERYKLKNGMQDLLKAQHYLAKLIELETATVAPAPVLAPSVVINDCDHSYDLFEGRAFGDDNGQKNSFQACIKCFCKKPITGVKV